MNNSSPSYLITGPSKAGKSTLGYDILKYIQKQGLSAGGVITLQNDRRWFYLIQSKLKIPFEAEDDQPSVNVGKFRISKDNLNQANDHIQNALGLDFLFIDEVGILEMNGGGYFPILESAFSRTQGNIIVVRESIFEEFRTIFNLNFDYEVLRCSFDLNPSHLVQMKRKIDKEFFNQ
jgi:nucleoside-triphosphatase THEP1